MYSLTPPDRNGLSDFDSIVARRDSSETRNQLVRIRDDIATAYSEYIRHSGNGELVQPINVKKEIGDELKANFRSLDRRRKHEFIRDEILSIADLDLCPYCSFATVVSLDHSLPTLVYPEFAVLAQNIVPCCDRCNSNKNDHCFRTSGGNLMHPYYIEFPCTSILFADVTVAERSVTWQFYVRSNSDIDDEAFKSVGNLFSRLKLADLYGKQSVIEIMGMVEGIHISFQSAGTIGLRDSLKEQSDRLFRRFGANYWKAVMLRSVSESTEFCAGGYEKLMTPPNLK